MTAEILDILKSCHDICDDMNVGNFCEEHLSNYNYRFGTSKIVILEDNKVYKATFNDNIMDEVAIYQKALENNLGHFFAVTSSLKADNVYIQEKIDISLNDYIHNLGDNKIPYGKIRNYYRDCGLEEMLVRSDCAVLWYLTQEYSISEIFELQSFIVKNDLNDLNFYNAGFKDGKLKFFDFGGWVEIGSTAIPLALDGGLKLTNGIKNDIL